MSGSSARRFSFRPEPIDSIDPDSETVFVNRTKDEIKDAPEFDPERYKDESYRSELGTYYGRMNEPAERR